MFCSISFGMEAPAAPLIEEGWRYGGSLKVKVADAEFDVEPIHRPMAYMVDEAPTALKGGDPFFGATSVRNPARYYCCFRFTTVVNSPGEGGLQLGRTIAITSDMRDDKLQDMGTGHEYIFASGYSDPIEPDPKKASFFSSYDATPSVRGSSTVRKSSFVIGYPTGPRLPYNFLTRNYMDPEVLWNNVSFRYKDLSSSFLAAGPTEKFKEIHHPTLGEIVDRNNAITAALEKAKSLVLSTDITTLLAPLRELEPAKRSLGTKNGSATNSYTCAEQTGLDFITDKRIFEALQSRLKIATDGVVGLLIHSHTTAEPCGTCSTSLARECEDEGIFKLLATGKPLRLINTTSDIYRRPERQIPVKETTSFHHMVGTSLAEFDSPISFDFSAPPLPFTTILYKSASVGGTDYSVDTSHIKMAKDAAAAAGHA
jgi:hypothetical protein